MACGYTVVGLYTKHPVSIFKAENSNDQIPLPLVFARMVMRTNSVSAHDNK